MATPLYLNSTGLPNHFHNKHVLEFSIFLVGLYMQYMSRIYCVVCVAVHLQNWALHYFTNWSHINLTH